MKPFSNGLSAATVSVGEGGYFTVTGTTNINDIDFAVDKAGRSAWIRFSGALTLIHSPTLILPTAANISAAPNDVGFFVSEGSDIVRCLVYQRADGTALVAPDTSKVVQVVSASDSAVATTTNLIPVDDTVPQNLEGAEFLTVSITPVNGANKLHVFVNCLLGSSNVTQCAMALFKNSDSSALAATAFSVRSNGEAMDVTLNHTMIAAVTSNITFCVRAGCGSAGTLTFNGSGGSRRFGGVAASSIVVMEVKP